MTNEPGRQPEEDGRLRCLACGRWFRLLPPHLGRAHSMSAAEYRDAYRLPRSLSLRAADLNETAREQGRARYADRPDIRAAMAAGRQIIDPNAAVAGSRTTAGYELVREARRRGGQGKQKASRDRMDKAARALGFPDIDAYLKARTGMKVAAIARELAVPRTTVMNWIARCADADRTEQSPVQE